MSSWYGQEKDKLDLKCVCDFKATLLFRDFIVLKEQFPLTAQQKSQTWNSTENTVILKVVPCDIKLY
jgi:hypothetical protein